MTVDQFNFSIYLRGAMLPKNALPKRRSHRSVILKLAHFILSLLSLLAAATATIGWISGKPSLATVPSSKLPMALSASILFIITSLISIAMVLRKKSRRFYIFLIGVTIIVFITATILLVLSLTGITSDLEISIRMTNISFLFSSPMTSLFFMLLSLSLLGNLFNNRRSLYLALISSFTLVLTGIILVIAFILGASIMTDSGMIPPSQATAIELILLGTSLLLYSMHQISVFGGFKALLRKKHIFTLLTVFLTITVLFSATGYFALRTYRNLLRHNITEQLISITNLKVNELVNWMNERTGDAAVYYHNDNFAKLVESALQDMNNPRKKNDLRERMWIERNAHIYDHVFMLDTKGKLIQDAPEHQHNVPFAIIENAQRAIQEDQVVFVDFYKNENDMLELAVLSPIYSNESRKPLGTLCMTINPSATLLPNLLNWPSPYKTSRLSLLRLRREQFKIIVDTAVDSDSSFFSCMDVGYDDPAFITCDIIDGKLGLMEGLSNDGKHVNAMLAKVPEDNWYILAQIETNEAYRPLKQRLWLLISSQVILLLAAAFIIELVWRRQRNTALAEQVEMQGALLREKDKYKRTIDSLIEGFQILDKDWRYVYINQKAAEYGRYPIDEFLGKSVLEMYPGFDETELYKRFRACVEKGKPDHFEYDFRYPDNTSEWFLFSVQPSEEGLVILTTNVTVRKKAEFRIDHLNRVLRSIRDVNQLIVHETNADMLIKSACGILVQNQSYRNAMIVLIDEQQKPDKWFTAGQERPLEIMTSVFEQRTIPVCYRTALNKGRFYCMTGEAESCPSCPLIPEFEGSQSFVIKLEHNENLFGILHVIMESDIIADKEEELLIVELADDVAYALNMMQNVRQKNALEKQLQEARKLEAIGRLAGGVAHDFNNMLQTILGYSDILLDEYELESEMRDFLEEIKSAAKRSAELTYQLLAFSRKQTIEPKVIRINTLIDETYRMLKRLIGEDIELLWQPGEKMLPVKMDPSQINQLLMNLCVNARDAIPGNGTIGIETSMLYLDDEEKLAQFELKQGNYIVISVSDTGKGIRKKNLDKIYEPFFTTKDVGKGTGLGLATVYGIVKQNQGNINVYSEVGKGTTFRIYLPAYTEPGTFVETPKRIKPPKGVETILLVEDSEQLLALTKLQLEKLGYKVIAFNDPEKALNAFETIDKLDLLVTDVIMPVMSGRDLWDSLRERKPDISCLFMSGYTSNVISHHGVLDSGINFISKPFTIKDIATKIREILSE